MSNPLCVKEKILQAKDAVQDAYLYSAARFRTRAIRLLTPEALARIGESGRIEELTRQLSERGIEIAVGADGHLMVEEALERYLKDSFIEVERNVPDPEWVALFRYPYDAHNIKTILKCNAQSYRRGYEEKKNPFSLLVDLGTVSPEIAEEAIRTGRCEVFSKAMAQAILQASSIYAQTSDPQLIDAIIDSACFSDMLALANRHITAPFGEIIRCRIDMTNLLTAIRIGRMSQVSVEYFSRHYIPGGKLSERFFQKHFGEGEDALLLAASKEGYPTLRSAVSAGLRLSELEKRCEAVVSAATCWTIGEPMGVKVIYAYLADREKEVKNIRILLAAMQAGRTPAKIRELLRA